MATKFQNFMNDNVRALKHALENLDTGKSTFRRILTGILSKHSENSELKPNLNSGESGVFDRYYNDINMSKIHDCERNLSPMI